MKEWYRWVGGERESLRERAVIRCTATASGPRARSPPAVFFFFVSSDGGSPFSPLPPASPFPRFSLPLLYTSVPLSWLSLPLTHSLILPFSPTRYPFTTTVFHHHRRPTISPSRPSHARARDFLPETQYYTAARIMFVTTWQIRESVVRVEKFTPRPGRRNRFQLVHDWNLWSPPTSRNPLSAKRSRIFFLAFQPSNSAFERLPIPLYC